MEYLIILISLFVIAVALNFKYRIHLYQSKRERFLMFLETEIFFRKMSSDDKESATGEEEKE